jgi:hypothetical protein
MELLKVITDSCGIRQLEKDAISDEIIRQLLVAACLASPSQVV